MKIKDLKRNQFFFYQPPNFNEPEEMRVWMHPYLNGDGVWEVECTTGDDYCFFLNESDEPHISELRVYD